MAPPKAPTSSGSGSSTSIIDSSGGGATVAQRLASLKSGHYHHHHHHLLQPDDKWVPVSWMPHTTLSQTSHVCVEIRSALVVNNSINSISNIIHAVAAGAVDSKEWRVQATIQGIAGLYMAGSLIPCQTPAAVVLDSSASSAALSQLAIMGANRVCKWDRVLHLPMRWRDLPRDAYLQLEVVSEKSNQVVRRQKKLNSGSETSVLCGVVSHSYVVTYSSRSSRKIYRWIWFLAGSLSFCCLFWTDLSRFHAILHATRKTQNGLAAIGTCNT